MFVSCIARYNSKSKAKLFWRAETGLYASGFDKLDGLLPCFTEALQTYVHSTVELSDEVPLAKCAAYLVCKPVRSALSNKQVSVSVHQLWKIVAKYTCRKLSLIFHSMRYGPSNRLCNGYTFYLHVVFVDMFL